MDMAVWGELASTAAKSKGIKSTIIYGCARDLDAYCTWIILFLQLTLDQMLESL